MSRREAGRAGGGWRRFAEDRAAVAGAAIVAALVLVALLAPVIAPYGAFQETNAVLAGPSGEHLLGTDQLGRDVLSEVLWGSRASILFGFVVGATSLVVGVILGGVAGYFGGWLDHLVSRLLEIVVVFPSLLVLVVFATFFGSDLTTLAIVAGLVSWPANARITRAQMMSLRKEPFVTASRAAGVGELRTLFRHVLPNGLAPVVANATLMVGFAVILEASLGFLGLGDADVASWGQVLQDGQNYLTTAPWISTSAGLAIFILVLGLNMLGDSINAALGGPGATVRRGALRDPGRADLAAAIEAQGGGDDRHAAVRP